MVTEDSILAISRLLFEAMNKRDFSLVEEHLDEEMSFDFPGINPVEGRKRVIIMLKALHRKFPELVFNIIDIIIADNKSVVIWSNSGFDIHGKEYSNRGNTLLYFESGKVKFMSDYFKDTSFTSS